jgi:hypothetical protein
MLTYSDGLRAPAMSSLQRRRSTRIPPPRPLPWPPALGDVVRAGGAGPTVEETEGSRHYAAGTGRVEAMRMLVQQLRRTKRRREPTAPTPLHLPLLQSRCNLASQLGCRASPTQK